MALKLVTTLLAAPTSGPHTIIPVSATTWYLVGRSTVTAAANYVLKSTDAGISWTAVQSITTNSTGGFSCWYDGSLIHILYLDTTVDDIFYVEFDPADDSMTAAVAVFAGATLSGAANAISIAKSAEGNLFAIFDGDAGTEKGFYKSTDGGGTWSAALSDPTEGGDWFILLPGNFTDQDDMVLIFWDRSADELSYKVYDDSANSWSETSISTGMVDSTSASPQFDAMRRTSDGHIIVIAWNAYDSATADLKCWDIDPNGATVTAKTDVVTNSDDCIACALYIDQATDDLYAFYLGKSDGSETAGGAIGLYYKVSTDGGANWGSEQTVFAARTHDTNFTGLAGGRGGSFAWPGAMALGQLLGGGAIANVPDASGGAAMLVNSGGLVG